MGALKDAAAAEKRQTALVGNVTPLAYNTGGRGGTRIGEGAMKTLDLRKKLKRCYQPSTRAVEALDIPRFKFIMLDGVLSAGKTPQTSADFHSSIGAMYGLAYTLKFASKLRKTRPIDYPVMALEGLWWTEGGGFDFDRKHDWSYRLMILVPDHIDAPMFRAALRQLKEKRPNPALDRARLASFEEGLCMQIMHVGPYAEEPKTIARMREFAKEGGYSLRGRHHEIYLGDPRRSAPARLKTVLRQPIRRRRA